MHNLGQPQEIITQTWKGKTTRVHIIDHVNYSTFSSYFYDTVSKRKFYEKFTAEFISLLLIQKINYYRVIKKGCLSWQYN
jgi:hypothetical protein